MAGDLSKAEFRLRFWFRRKTLIPLAHLLFKCNTIWGWYINISGSLLIYKVDLWYHAQPKPRYYNTFQSLLISSYALQGYLFASPSPFFATELLKHPEPNMQHQITLSAKHPGKAGNEEHKLHPTAPGCAIDLLLSEQMAIPQQVARLKKKKI